MALLGEDQEGKGGGGEEELGVGEGAQAGGGLGRVGGGVWGQPGTSGGVDSRLPAATRLGQKTGAWPEG